MKSWFWIVGLGLLGFAVAQGTATLVIAGKKSVLPWITVKQKVYIPLEALQKAGLVVKKNGSTYDLSFPKPAQSAQSAQSASPTSAFRTPVASTPTAPVVVATPAPVVVATPAPVVATPTSAPVAAIPAPAQTTLSSSTASNLQNALNQSPSSNETPSGKTSDLEIPNSSSIPKSLLPVEIPAPVVAAPVTPAPVVAASAVTPTPVPTAPAPVVAAPVTPVPVVTAPAPVVPVTTTGSVTTVSVVNTSASKPLLEGCSNQVLNNGVWSAKLVANTNISVGNRSGFAFVLEMTNLTKDSLSLFDAGFTDGEGGLSNFILVTTENRIYSARDTNAEFAYQVVAASQKLIFTVKFTFDSAPMGSPARLFITQERRVPGFTMPDPSLRFQLGCK